MTISGMPSLKTDSTITSLTFPDGESFEIISKKIIALSVLRDEVLVSY